MNKPSKFSFYDETRRSHTKGRDVKIRTCLVCGEQFMSDSNANRQCPACGEKATGYHRTVHGGNWKPRGVSREQ